MKRMLSYLVTISFIMNSVYAYPCKKLVSKIVSFNNTEKIYNSLYERDVFSSADHRYILSIFKQDDLDASKKIELAFEYYIDKRINLIPSVMDSGKVIKDKFDKLKKEFHEIKVRNTHYESRVERERSLKILSIDLALYFYKVSAVETTIGLNDYVFKDRNFFFVLFRGFRLLFNAVYGVQLRHAFENSGMRAEWSFINSLPRETIDDAVKRLSQIEVSDKETLKVIDFLTRALSNANLPLNEYLREEYKNNRYSYSSLLTKSIIHTVITGAAALVVYATYQKINSVKLDKEIKEKKKD